MVKEILGFFCLPESIHTILSSLEFCYRISENHKWLRHWLHPKQCAFRGTDTIFVTNVLEPTRRKTISKSPARLPQITEIVFVYLPSKQQPRPTLLDSPAVQEGTGQRHEDDHSVTFWENCKLLKASWKVKKYMMCPSAQDSFENFHSWPLPTF